MPRVADVPRVAAPRRRRSTPQLRRAILDAAETLFAAQGFRGTSTRAVATRAGVSEALVYTQFGTKSALFEAAVTDRYETFVADFLDSPSGSAAPGSLTELVHGFVVAFAEFLVENRSILLTYMEYRRVEVGPRVPAVADFGAALGGFEQVLNTHQEWHGLDAEQVQFVVRAVISMVLGLVLHEDLLYSGMKPHDRGSMATEVTSIVVGGLASGATRPSSSQARARRAPR